MSVAKERNKNVFIDTYASWCVPCKRMDQKFKNKDVATFFNEHFINLKVNMQNPTRANELRRKYDVVFLPTMYILSPDGAVKYHTDGELSVDELLNAAQLSLNPGSFVSEATAVRRTDGTITGGTVSNQPVVTKPATVVAPPQKQTPKQAHNADVAVVEKAKAPIDPAEGNLSISEATRRAKILDSYETVDESSQKVLAVLGSGDMPPEVLRQEAYLRLEFMDGSHRSVARKYLDSQIDWNTAENRKFIVDFINNTYSKEYAFLIKHKDEFVEQFGAKTINRTLEVLNYKTLFNAVPRPTIEEAIDLFSNVDESSAFRKAHHYFVNRLMLEQDKDQVVSMSSSYLNSEPTDHEMMYMVARFLVSQDSLSDDDLAKSAKLMESATAIFPKSVIYLDLLGSIYSEQGNQKRATKIFDKASKEAADQKVDYKQTESKSQASN